MQAAGIEAFGGDVRLLELAEPGPPAQDELVISVRAAGVANWDEIVRVGEWDVGRKPPLALGVEAAGVVIAVGEAVGSFAAGDEVITHPVPLRQQGTWAQLLVAPAALVAEGWVLVNGAAGVTGGLMVQLAVSRGATVVATAGPSSESRVRDHGARVVFDYHDPDWPDRVRDASPGGRGVDAAVNAAPRGAASALKAVADNGRLATITGDPPPAERGITVTDVYVEADGARLAALAGPLEFGLLSLDVGATFGLSDAANALRGAVTGRVAGATVLTPDP
jgi:NADPH:quinone reductase-like Zn-dependent oxidoreductase